jgi:hypothetical protein
VAPAVVLTGFLRELDLPNRERLAAAEAWKAGLPEEIQSACRNREGAQALVYLLLLSGEIGLKQVHASSPVLEALERLREHEVPIKDRLPLVDLALPVLRHLIPPDRARFLDEVERLCQADGQISLFEYALCKILRDALDPGHAAGPGRRRLHIGKATHALNVMFSALARLGAASEGEAESAFELAESRMFGYTGGQKLRLLPGEACGLEVLHRACEDLADLHPSIQQRALLAGLAAITHDDQIEAEEAEAFRALAAAMHIPVPPHLMFGKIG